MSGSGTPTPTPTVNPVYDDSGYLGAYPDVDRLFDNVQALVQQVDLPLVKMMAWNAIEDFCIRSSVRRELLNWSMPIGTSQIDFDPYDETSRVAWVLQVTGLTHYMVKPPGLVLDLEFPSAVRSGTVTLALAPMEFGVDYPGYFWSQFFETILAGTVARLFSMPQRPFSNPQLMQFYWRRFNAGVAKAYAEADKGWTDGPGRWHFPYFAFGRRKQ